MRIMDSAVQDFADRIQDAVARGAALRIRGGGSKDFYGGAPVGELLDTRTMNGIVAYEPSELYVSVRSGTRLAELEAILAAQGQYLPFEPPHFSQVEYANHGAQSAPPPPPPGGGVRGGGNMDGGAADGASVATAGGMLACGLGGPARATVGGPRDHVLGVSMLNGRGEWLVFGGQVMKNVAGYDLSRVFAGSMGTLGLIVEMSLKVLPIPPADATLRFEADQAAALALLQRWNALALPLNASCWVQEAGRGILLLRLRGAAAAVRSACLLMGGEALDPAVARRQWADCRDQRLSFFAPPPAAQNLGLWRLSIAPGSPPLTWPGAQLIEWHGALRWLWAAPDQQAAIRAAALQAGGHATLFRASQDGLRRDDRFQPLPAASLRIQQELKRQFDPAGVFNPGRLVPGL
jgi:glycolate oxidase FAD binding subunit